MLDKIHCIQRQNQGGRIILATGTPITNSITDIFVMQKYLQDGELEFLGIHNFDNWAGMFAQKTTEFEIGVDTNSYKLTYQNLLIFYRQLPIFIKLKKTYRIYRNLKVIPIRYRRALKILNVI